MIQAAEARTHRDTVSPCVRRRLGSENPLGGEGWGREAHKDSFADFEKSICELMNVIGN